jgi:putative ABC transport system permease protein
VILIAFYLFVNLNASGTVKLLQNKQRWHGQNAFGRGLIVLQFACAIGLMFSAVVYYRQMNFISSKDLGFNPGQLVQIGIPHSRPDAHNARLFKEELKNLPPVVNVTTGGMHPYTSGTLDVGDVHVEALEFHVDEAYIPTLQIKMKQGRNFSSAMTTDSDAVVVNESFVHEAGWDSPLLKKINVEGKSRTVIGVIHDYHTASFRQTVRPQVITLGDNDNIMLRLRNDQLVSSLAAVEKVFREHYPEHYFQLTFIDDVISDQYANELRWKSIITYATVVAILICCMGLFGMGHFTTQKRTKEIGIRKVLGASVPNLVNVIVYDFLKPVVVSAMLVLPVAWYIMNSWLEDYSYRININVFDILFTGMIAFLIVVVSVGSTVLRSALQNPVVSLKVE